MMFPFLRRLGASGRASAPGGAGQHWQRVPRFNFILRPQQRSLASTLLLLLLVAAVATEAYLGVTWMQEQNDIEETIDNTQRLASSVEVQLTDKHVAINDLETQINQIKRKGTSLEEAFQEVTGGRTRWSSLFSAVFAVQMAGVQFTTVATGPDGTLDITGVATDRDVITQFQKQIVDAPLLGLQSITTLDPPDEDGDGAIEDGLLSFIATLELTH